MPVVRAWEIRITHLQYISPQFAAAQEENSLLGLVVALNVVRHDQWEFGNSVNDMTWIKKEFNIRFRHNRIMKTYRELEPKQEHLKQR